MRYVLSIILILAMIVSTSSCLSFFNREDTTQLAKDEFSQYFNGKNEVVLEFSNELHFEDHILKHDDLEFSGTHINYVFYDNFIYYASEDSKNGCINFYSCDLYGKNVQKIYSHFWNEGNDVTVISGREYSFFIKSVNDDFVFIDKYTVPTNVYEKIDKGKKGEKFDLSNYQEENNSKYSIEMIKKTVVNIPNVEVDHFDGLLADYAKIKNAGAVIKGLRAVTDFEYEFQMALTNKKLNPNTETVFLTTSAENMYLSSSMVKQIGTMGGDITDFVPSVIHKKIKNRSQSNSCG